MNEAAVLEQRRQARSAKQLVDATLIDLHLKAARALLSPSKSADVRKQALQQVARWERDHLCNPRYIGAWRTILDLPLASIQSAMLQDDPEGVALRQNSPFGFLLRNLPK